MTQAQASAKHLLQRLRTPVIGHGRSGYRDHRILERGALVHNQLIDDVFCAIEVLGFDQDLISSCVVRHGAADGDHVTLYHDVQPHSGLHQALGSLQFGLWLAWRV